MRWRCATALHARNRQRLAFVHEAPWRFVGSGMDAVSAACTASTSSWMRATSSAGIARLRLPGASAQRTVSNPLSFLDRESRSTRAPRWAASLASGLVAEDGRGRGVGAGHQTSFVVRVAFVTRSRRHSVTADRTFWCDLVIECDEWHVPIVVWLT